jgi:hypothetical protein
MKNWFAGVTPVVVVGVAFQLAARIQPVGWRLLATIAACFILGALYVPKYPVSEISSAEVGRESQARPENRGRR